MTESKIITLPIQSHIKKFVQHEFGDQILFARQNNTIGRSVLQLLNKHGKYPKPPKKQFDTIQIELGDNLIRHKNRIIRTAFHMDLFIDHFMIALRHSVESSRVFYGSRRLAIIAFLSRYGILESEISVNTCERFFHSRNDCQVYQKVKKGDELIKMALYIELLQSKLNENVT
ncbi:hypothetical protein [Flammeovirga pacifica]|uniref:Uncharacterized protein n=1 Tax=Flammeovirga pacifica TaxID=915059 RepID=A0A1S1Z264_FLAPC|nr:hypothetical protein [Flammeovirga pacifica]OHX67360.1 hypothetical protein NH26_13915 [Flammeovirga pacifica]